MAWWFGVLVDVEGDRPTYVVKELYKPRRFRIKANMPRIGEGGKDARGDFQVSFTELSRLGRNIET